MQQCIMLSILALASSQAVYGSLMSVGPVSISGAGLGAVYTLFTVTSPGSSSFESGCVGWNGSGTTSTLAICPAGFAGGNNQAINNTYTLAQMGLSNFGNLQMIFNASEPGKNGITLENLALTLYGGDGTLLASFTLAAPVTINSTEPGVGNAGFGFELDASSTTVANSFLEVEGLRIGAAVNASDATGGHETLFIRTIETETEGGGTGGDDGGTIPPNEIHTPEPVTFAGVGFTLLALALWGRKIRRRVVVR